MESESELESTVGTYLQIHYKVSPVTSGMSGSGDDDFSTPALEYGSLVVVRDKNDIRAIPLIKSQVYQHRPRIDDYPQFKDICFRFRNENSRTISDFCPKNRSLEKF